MNNNTLPTMPTGHAATLRRMPSRCAGQAEAVADDLPPQDAGGANVDLGVQQPQEYVLEIHVILHSSGRTNAGVEETLTVAPSATAVTRSREPPIRTFTVGPGVSPHQPLGWMRGVADCHRRFGLTPTPVHARVVNSSPVLYSDLSASQSAIAP